MRKGKILNYLITILSTLVVVSGTVLVYQLLTREKYSVSFNLNGASSIDANNIECDLSIKGCIVTIPNAAAKDGEVLGYNLNNDDTFAIYKAGDKVLLDDDMTLYAITYKKNTVKIDASNIDFIENKEVSCNAYNNQSCKVKLPIFNKVGYSNLGYSTTSKKSSGFSLYEYLPNEEYELDGNVTLYPQNDSLNKQVYNTSYHGIIGNDILEVEKSLSSSTINTFKNYLEGVKNKAPYLLTSIKINILSEASFNRYWYSILGKTPATVLGVTYHTPVSIPPKDTTIDVKSSYSGYSQSESYEEFYHVLVHEMSHAWDSYYPFALKGVVPKNISSSTEKIHDTKDYFDAYSLGCISNHQDVVNLYNKYKTQKNRPISTYAYSKRAEFWAEIMSFYYLKYIVPTGHYASIDYPDDIKKVVEKYICIAKNNYRNNGCY